MKKVKISYCVVEHRECLLNVGDNDEDYMGQFQEAWANDEENQITKDVLVDADLDSAEVIE